MTFKLFQPIELCQTQPKKDLLKIINVPEVVDNLTKRIIKRFTSARLWENTGLVQLTPFQTFPEHHIVSHIACKRCYSQSDVSEYLGQDYSKGTF